MMQVIGVPDDRLGEQVAAWIRLKDGQNCTQREIVDFCKGKASHRYRRPMCFWWNLTYVLQTASQTQH